MATTLARSSSSCRPRSSSIVPCWKTFLLFARPPSLSPLKCVMRPGTPRKRTPYCASTRQRSAFPKPKSKRLPTCSPPASPTRACASKTTLRSNWQPGENASTPGLPRASTSMPIANTKMRAKHQLTLASSLETRTDATPLRRFQSVGPDQQRAEGFLPLQRQRFVHRREFLGKERVEFRGNVLQFFLQRIDARDLIIGRPPFVIQNVSVELRGFLANALFSGDRAAFLRGHDLLAHFFCLLRQFLQPLAEECVSFQFCRAIHQRIVHAVDALNIKAHVAKQVVNAHRRVEFQFAVLRSEFGARIESHHKLCGIALRAARHLHCVGAGENSGAQRGLERRGRRGGNTRRLEAHGQIHTTDAAPAVRG